MCGPSRPRHARRWRVPRWGAAMAYLEIHIMHDIQRISLDRDHLRLGRLADNDIVLHDAQISRQHAEMRFASGHWRIMDLGSTNGLHFKGKRVREHHFNHGDVLLLAPTVTLCFREGIAPADAVSTRAPRVAPVARRQPPAAQAAAPVESPGFDLLRPRSPFADDEQPYYPSGMGMPAPPTHYQRQNTPAAPHANGGSPAVPPPTPSSSSQFDTIPSGGYPVPSGPLTSGSDGDDPFRRSGVRNQSDANRATAGPTSTLLHVCQTCGQLTAPDSVYCQSCHHSIARECGNCRFSMLPIQERCPRCQTPNPGSVRRAHRAPGA